MSTKYKIRDQHGLYYMTCPLVGWIDLFTRKVYQEMVFDSWRYCQKYKGFQVHAFTVMPSHIHLIASCKTPFQLQNVMRDWKHYTARCILEYLNNKSQTESRRDWLLYMFSYFAANKKNKQDYQVWQHDNHPIVLYSEAVISQKMEYIHQNAVRAGYVELPEHWSASSAPFYAATSHNTPINNGAYLPPVEIMPIWSWFYEEGPGAW